MEHQNDIMEISKLVKKQFNEDSVANILKLELGLTNRSYRVDINAGSFVIRFPGEGTEEIINREDEYISNKLACDLSIDTNLLFFDKTGVKISEFILEPLTMSPELLRQESNIIMAAEIFRKLHSCGVNTKVDFDVRDKIDIYERFIIKNNIGFYDDYNERKKTVSELISIFHKPSDMVPCHNDPLCENWIYGNGRMYLIDWEYAGMNDPIWDVSVLSVESSMEPEQDQILLKSYLKRDPAADDMRHFLANKVLLDFLWSLWGKTRVPASGIEMEQYARERYDRMILNIEALS